MNALNATDLRKAISSAIFDPSQTEGMKGERDLTTWQTDAVIRVIDKLVYPIATASAEQAGPTKDDMEALGVEVWDWIETLTEQDGPLKGWSPAEDPSEIVPDLYNMLEESLACHAQACGETKALADLVLEMAEAIDNAAEDIGNGQRGPLVILREAVKVAEAAKVGKTVVKFPDGFRWINGPATVKGGDYEYDGTLLLSFPKGVGGSTRYIVMDQNRRLFIHNAQQLGIEVAA